MVIFFILYYHWLLEFWLTGVKSQSESWVVNYIVKHPVPVDSLVMSDLKVYFVGVSCVCFLDSHFYSQPLSVSSVQLDHKVVAKFQDKSISRQEMLQEENLYLFKRVLSNDRKNVV